MSNQPEIIEQNPQNNPLINFLSQQGFKLNEPVIINLNKEGKIEIKRLEELDESKSRRTRPQVVKNRVRFGDNFKKPTVDNYREWQSQADQVLEKVKANNTLDVQQAYTLTKLSQSLTQVEREINQNNQSNNNIQVNNYPLQQLINDKQQQESPLIKEQQKLSEQQSSNLVLHQHDLLIAKQLKIISSLHSGNNSGGLKVEGEKYNLEKIGSDYTLKNQENKVLMKFRSDSLVGAIVFESHLDKEQRLSISEDLKEHIESFGLAGSLAPQNAKYKEQLKLVKDLSKTLNDYTARTKESKVINGNYYRIDLNSSGELRIDDKINNRGALYIESQGILLLNKLNPDDLTILSNFKQRVEHDLSLLSQTNIAEAQIIQSNNTQSVVSTKKKELKTNEANFNSQFQIVEPPPNLIINDDKKYEDKKKDKDKDKGLEL